MLCRIPSAILQINKPVLYGLILAGLMLFCWFGYFYIPRFSFFLMGIAAFGIAALFWQFPILWAIGAAVLVTGNIAGFVPGIISPFLLAGVLTFVLKSIISHQPVLTITPVLKWGILFIVGYFTTLLWSSSYDFLEFGGLYRSVLMILLITWIIRDDRQLCYVVIASGIGMILTAAFTAYSIIDFFQSGVLNSQNIGSYESSQTRFFGQWADPNIMGQTLVPFIGLNIAILRTRLAPWMRIAAAISVIAGIASVSMSLSRAALVSLIVVIVLIMLADKRRWLLLLGTSAVILLVISIFPIDVIGRIETLSQGTGDTSIRERARLYVGGLQMAEDAFPLGIGPGNFRTYSQDYVWSLPWSTIPHNTYTEIMSESGLLGSILFLLSLIAVYRELWIPKWRIQYDCFHTNLGICMKATFFSTIISCLFLSFSVYTPFWMVFSLMGIRNAIHYY